MKKIKLLVQLRALFIVLLITSQTIVITAYRSMNETPGEIELTQQNFNEGLRRSRSATPKQTIDLTIDSNKLLHSIKKEPCF